MFKLVGHRGLPEKFPENSLLGFQNALIHGADAIECDIQFDRSGEAYILHDPDFKRVGNLPTFIHELSEQELQQISVHEPNRFNQTYYPCPLPHLSSLIPLMQRFPDRLLFAEIKTESYDWITRKACVDTLITLLKPILHQVVFISFDKHVIQMIKQHSQCPIGWVLNQYDEQSKSLAEQWLPDYLICDKQKLPDLIAQLWPGSWEWFIYDVIHLQEAKKYHAMGANWIETWDVTSLQQQMDQAT